MHTRLILARGGHSEGEPNAFAAARNDRPAERQFVHILSLGGTQHIRMLSNRFNPTIRCATDADATAAVFPAEFVDHGAWTPAAANGIWTERFAGTALRAVAAC